MKEPANIESRAFHRAHAIAAYVSATGRNCRTDERYSRPIPSADALVETGSVSPAQGQFFDRFGEWESEWSLHLCSFQADLARPGISAFEELIGHETPDANERLNWPAGTTFVEVSKWSWSRTTGANHRGWRRYFVGLMSEWPTPWPGVAPDRQPEVRLTGTSRPCEREAAGHSGSGTTVRGVPTLHGPVTSGDGRRPEGWPRRGVMG